MSPLRKSVLVLVSLVSIAGGGCSNASSDRAAGVTTTSTVRPSATPPKEVEAALAAPRGFVEVGIHTYAARQPNARGKKLHVLSAHSGKVYSGYGDYGDNTGPITIAPFDPASRRFRFEHTQDTDAIEQYRELDGDLWSPAIDTKVNNDYARQRVRSWAEVNLSDAAWHVYDVASAGSALFLSGSSAGADDDNDNFGVVWKSTDDGRSWTTDHRSDDPTPNYRCYTMATFAGKVYVDCGPLSHPNGSHPDHFVNDGTSWTRTDLDLGHFSSQQFADLLVTIRDNRVVSFDGATVRDLGQDATVLAQENGVLYAKDGSNIYRTADVAFPSWTLVASYGGSDAISFTVLDGYAYLGTAESKLLRSAGRVR